jgi:hypothetical protein
MTDELKTLCDRAVLMSASATNAAKKALQSPGLSQVERATLKDSVKAGEIQTKGLYSIIKSWMP